MTTITEAIQKVNKAEFYRKWIRKLYSGEVKRTTEVLKNEKGYCCLGVACQILSDDTGIEFSRFGKGMPIPTVQKFMFDEAESDTADTLAGKNDDGRTFKKTAAVILTYAKKQGILPKETTLENI